MKSDPFQILAEASDYIFSKYNLKDNSNLACSFIVGREKISLALGMGITYKELLDYVIAEVITLPKVSPAEDLIRELITLMR